VGRGPWAALGPLPKRCFGPPEGPCFGTRGVQEKKKKPGVPTYLLFLRFFEIFRSDFFEIFMVFLGSSCRETAKKRDKKNSMGKDERKKVFFFSTFSAKSF
jgi:hypothetical protein